MNGTLRTGVSPSLWSETAYASYLRYPYAYARTAPRACEHVRSTCELMDSKLWVFPMDHRGTGDSPETAGEGAGIELQRPQHARVTNVLRTRVKVASKFGCFDFLARAKDSRNFDTPTATISIEINAQISEIIAKFMNEIWGGRQRNSGLGQLGQVRRHTERGEQY